MFHEEAATAGINQTYDGGWEHFVGGGGAALDCDGSGFPSVFLAGGKNPAKLYVNKSARGGPLRFEEKPIGVDPDLLKGVIGAYPLDFDGDGHVDLFVLRVGENLLLKGGPNCTFTLANKEWNFGGDAGWTTSFAAEWEKGQKFPTLAIGHYVDRSRARLALWNLRGELALSPAARRQAGLFRAHAADAGLLRAVDAVHRLEPLGHAEPARLQRPTILSRRRGAAVAHRAGQAAEAFTAAPRVGGMSRSSAWASPKATSTATVFPNTR